jgi:MFS family permease
MAESTPTPTAWSVLRFPMFRAMWLGSVAAGIGAVVQETTAAWLMTTLTTSPLPVALLQTAASLPVVLLALPAGAIADIVDRRRWMLGIQSLQVVLALMLGVLAAKGWLSAAALLILVFLQGCATALFTPASMRTVPDLLHGPDVPLGVTLNSTAVNIARAVGAALGGFVLATAFPGAGFLVYALLLSIPLTVLFHWSGAPRSSALPPEPVGGAILSGMRYARHSAGVRVVLLRAFSFAIFGGAIPALMPVVARRELGLDSLRFGLLTATFGAGALLGATLLAPLRQKLPLDRLMIAMTIVLAASAAGLALIRDLLWLAPVLVIGGAAWVTMVASFGVATGSGSSPWVLARMLSLYLLVFQGGSALAAAFWGSIATEWSTSAALLGAGAGLILHLAAIRIWPMPAPAPHRLTPSQHWPDPPAVTTAHDPDGPVLVTVDYEIQPDAAPGFLRAMVQVEQERRRDGAYLWNLFADLEHPGHYHEHFLLPSWVDHLRQHERVTHADRESESAARAFHQGPDGPVVRHYVTARPR